MDESIERPIMSDLEILIVEDSQTQALQLKYILEQHGYRVSISPDGAEALAGLSEHKPALVVSDIIMPKMDGYELCRKIRADEDLRDIPVILLTSLSDPRDIVKALECGADQFLVKPFEEVSLISRIQALLEKKQLDREGQPQEDIEVFFEGQKYLINPPRAQILDLLLSTYDTAVHKNFELVKAQEELRRLNQHLEAKVEERTETLRAEISERKRVEATVRSALDESRLQRGEISGLLQSARTVLEHPDFKEAAQAITESCKSLMGAASGICLFTPNGVKREIVLGEPGEGPGVFQQAAWSALRGPLEKAYRTAKPAYDNDPPHTRSKDHLQNGHERVSNVLFAPLVIGGAVAGLLGLADKPGGFTENDARAALAFGELIAIALQNSRTLQSLENSEERFRSVAETASDAIISVDRNRRIVHWNRGAETTFGYSSDEVIGQPLTVILPERFREAHEIGISGVISTGKPNIIGKTLELAGLRKDGTEFPLELSLATWKAREGTFFTGIIRDITDRKREEERIKQSLENLERVLDGAVQAIMLTTEKRDPYTAGHQRRVAGLACAIARELGLAPDQIEGLNMAAIVHDIGKIYVPAENLNKPGRLNDVEFGAIKTHSDVGYDILKKIDFPWPIARIVYQHHERLDGSGYPLGLKNDDILLEAKILGVADVVEAMASHRPYRPALGVDKALEEISQNEGILYDGGVAEACLAVFANNGFEFDYETPAGLGIEDQPVALSEMRV